jgi:hypothetical protein
MFLGHPVHPEAKAGGDNSMPEMREPLESAKAAIPEDPCDPLDLWRISAPCAHLLDLVETFDVDYGCCLE